MTPRENTLQYAVLAEAIDHEIEVKRSRFLCRLRRVDSEAAAREEIALARMEHRLARHHCSAFVLGADRQLRRSNDDGEPAGTAGTPMLDALTGRDTGFDSAPLSDTVAIVIRYFGGVLLGAGGLVRAYSDAVSSALDDAHLIRRERRRILVVEAPHAEAGRWEHELRAADTEVLDAMYGASGATLRVAVSDRSEDIDALVTRVATLSQGGAPVRDGGSDWVDLGSR